MISSNSSSNSNIYLLTDTNDIKQSAIPMLSEEKSNETESTLQERINNLVQDQEIVTTQKRKQDKIQFLQKDNREKKAKIEELEKIKEDYIELETAYDELERLFYIEIQRKHQLNSKIENLRLRIVKSEDTCNQQAKQLDQQTEQLAYLEKTYEEVVWEKIEKERECGELKKTTLEYKRLLDNLQKNIEGQVPVKETLRQVSPESITNSASTSTLDSLL